MKGSQFPSHCHTHTQKSHNPLSAVPFTEFYLALSHVRDRAQTPEGAMPPRGIGYWYRDPSLPKEASVLDAGPDQGDPHL